MAVGSVAAGRAYVLIQALDKTKAGIASANQSIQQMSKKFNDRAAAMTGQAMSAAASIGAVFTAPAAGLFAYSEFEKDMLTVQAKLHGSAEDYREVEKEVRRLGRTTAWTLDQVSKNAVTMSSQGLNKDQMRELLAPSLDLAMAVGSDSPADVTHTLLTTMHSLQADFSESARYADIFTTAVNGSALTMDSFAESLKMAAPFAKSAGVSIEELSAGLMAMANAGVEGSLAGTSMKNFLSRLAQRDKVFQEAGVQVFNEDGSFKDFAQIFTDIQAAVSTMSEKDRMNFIRKAFGMYGAAGISNMLNSKDMGKFLSVLQNCEGEAKKTAEHMQSGVWGTLKRIGSAAYDLAVTFGSVFSPIVRNLEMVIVSTLNTLNGWTSSTGKWLRLLFEVLGIAMGIGLVLAAVGLTLKIIGVMTGLISTALLAIRGILGYVQIILAGIPALIAKIGVMLTFLMAHPLGLVLGLLAAAAIAAALAFTNLGTIFGETFGGMVELVSQGRLGDAWELLVAGMKTAWYDFVYWIKSLFQGIINSCVAVGVKLQNAVAWMRGDQGTIDANNQWLDEFKSTIDATLRAEKDANEQRIEALKKKVEEAEKDAQFTPEDVSKLDESAFRMPAPKLIDPESVKKLAGGGASELAQMSTVHQNTESFWSTFFQNMRNATTNNAAERTADGVEQLNGKVDELTTLLEDEGIIAF